MTMRVPNTDKYLEDIVVILLEDIASIDPVSLGIYENVAQKEYSNARVSFILERKIGDEKSYHYLKNKGGRVTERYLYHPVQFHHFKKKKLCSELWHGCKIPSLNEIKHHAKVLRHQE